VSAESQNRQFQQLNTFRKERTTVHVYLLSGTRFSGRIRSFDVHTMLLETQSGDMVIYGHAISTVEPAVMSRGRGAGAVVQGGHRADSLAASSDDGDRSRLRSVRPPSQSAMTEVSGRPVLQRGARALYSESPSDLGPESPRGGVTPPAVTIVRRRSRLVPKQSG